MADIAKLVIAIEEQGGEKAAKTLDKVNKSTKKADKSTKDFTKTKKKSSQANMSLAKTTESLAGSIKTLGATAIAGAAIGMVKLAMEQERVNKEFQILVGNVEQGNKLFDDLNQLANQTPLDNFDLFPVARSLLAFGTSADDVTEKLTVLGNLALGDAEKMGRLADAYGKVQVKGKATLEELNRFAEAGVPIFEQLATNMGVTREELFKMVSQGKVRFNELDKALSDLTEEGSRFHNMMEEIANTGAGKLSTVIGKTKLQIASLGEETFPLVNAALDEFNTALESLKDGEYGEMFLQWARKAGPFGALLNHFGLLGDNIDFSDVAKDMKAMDEEINKLLNSTDLTDFNPAEGASGGVMKGVIPTDKDIKKAAKEAKEAQNAELASFDSMAVEWSEKQRELLEDVQKEQQEILEKGSIDRHRSMQSSIETEFQMQVYQRELAKSEQEMMLADQERYNQARVDGEKKRMEAIRAIQEQELDGYEAMFGGIASLFGVLASENKKYGNAYKAFALSEIVISTARGVAAALATGNVPLAIGIGAKGTAAGISVAQQEFADGGFVMGQPTGDRTLIGANGGEMLINGTMQNNLMNMLRLGQGSGGGDTFNVNFNGETPSNPRRFAKDLVKETEIIKRNRVPYTV